MQVGDNVVDMFGSYRKTDRIGLNTLIGKLFFGKLAVGCSRRMNDKAFNIGDICKQRENIKTVNKLVRFSLTALYLKGKDRTSAVWKILIVQSIIGMIGKRGMVNLINLRMRT